jgi:hypothetical protein
MQKTAIKGLLCVINAGSKLGFYVKAEDLQDYAGIARK